MVTCIDNIVLFRKKLEQVQINCSLEKFNQLPQYKKIAKLHSFAFKSKNNVLFFDNALKDYIGFENGLSVTLKVRNFEFDMFSHWLNFDTNKFEKIKGIVRVPYCSHIYEAFGKMIEHENDEAYTLER